MAVASQRLHRDLHMHMHGHDLITAHAHTPGPHLGLESGQVPLTQPTCTPACHQSSRRHCCLSLPPPFLRGQCTRPPDMELRTHPHAKGHSRPQPSRTEIVAAAAADGPFPPQNPGAAGRYDLCPSHESSQLWRVSSQTTLLTCYYVSRLQQTLRRAFAAYRTMVNSSNNAFKICRYDDYHSTIELVSCILRRKFILC